VKLKYYLRGMGIGLIVTTLILMITFSIHKTDAMSDEEIIERARALGMVTAEEAASSRNTLSTTDTTTDDTPDGDDVYLPDDTDTDDGSYTDDDYTDDGYTDDGYTDDGYTDDADTSYVDDGTEPDVAEDEPGTSDTVEQVEISIVGGEYSDVVSEKLRKAGVIDDVDDFNRYLAETGNDNLIQPGTYILPLGADYDTIINIITTKQENE
jgi:hypothetical protein